MPVREPLVVEEGVRIGENLDTGPFVVLRENCVIGDDVSIWSFSEVDEGARIGDRARLHVGVYVSQLCEVAAEVFLAPGVKLLNDKYPPRRREHWYPCRVLFHASIGANAVIMPGVIVGSYAMIGAGSVVLQDIPSGEVWAGNPARRIG